MRLKKKTEAETWNERNEEEDDTDDYRLFGPENAESRNNAKGESEKQSESGSYAKGKSESSTKSEKQSESARSAKGKIGPQGESEKQSESGTSAKGESEGDFSAEEEIEIPFEIIDTRKENPDPGLFD